MNEQTRKQKIIQLDMMTKMRLQLDNGIRLIAKLRPEDGIRLVVGAGDQVLIDLSLSASTLEFFFGTAFEGMLNDMGDTIEAAAKDLGGGKDN